MKKKLKQIIICISDPVFLTRIRLRSSIKEIISPLIFSGAKCLDVGCGDRPYEDLFKNGNYIGIDVEDSGRQKELKKPDVFYNGKTIPFDNNSFDIVFSSQVFEHLSNPSMVLSEMTRVVKTGGSIIISLPFVYPEHEVPYDYYRFTSYGVIDILVQSGLKVKTIKKDTSALETIAILVNVYITNNLMPKIKGIGYLYAILVCFPIQLISILLSKIFPDNGVLYLNIVAHAKKQ